MLDDDRKTELLERLCESIEALAETLKGAASSARQFEDEILSEAEVSELIGFKVRSKQIQWLQQRGWIHELSACGRPIIGRTYLRQKLGAQLPGSEQPDPDPVWTLDMSKVK